MGLGWFVGFIKIEYGLYIFVINVDDFGIKVKNIIVDILKKYGLIIF